MLAGMRLMGGDAVSKERMNRARCHKTEEAVGVKACVVEGARDAPVNAGDPGAWRVRLVAQQGVGRPGDLVGDAIVGAHESGEEEGDAFDERDGFVAPGEERGHPVVHRREEWQRVMGVGVGRRRDRWDGCTATWHDHSRPGSAAGRTRTPGPATLSARVVPHTPPPAPHLDSFPSPPMPASGRGLGG